MSFTVAAEAYDRFMGRYSVLLSPLLSRRIGDSDAPSHRSLSGAPKPIDDR